MGIMLENSAVCNILLEKGRLVVERLFAALENGEQMSRVDEVARKLWLELGEDILQAMLIELGRQIRHSDKPKPRCSRCAQPRRFKQMRSLKVRTALTGTEREIPSPMMVCDQCSTSVLWMRELLDLDEDGFTPRLRELSVGAGTIEPFEAAAEEVLANMVGVKVSGSKIHSLCQTAGAHAEQLMEQGQLGTPRPLQPGEKLYVEMDGAMLHIDGEWKETKLAIAFPQNSLAPISKDRRTITHRQVCYTRDKPEQLGQRIFKMVEPYLPKTPDGAPVIAGNVVALGDGSPWIRNLTQEILPGAPFVLDWYHMDEHIAEAARTLYPTNESERKRWTTRQENLLRDGRVDALLDGLLRKSMRLVPGSKEQQAVADLHSYLNERRESLKYRDARNQGLIIGSGAVESAMGYVLQQRMKRAGMRWHGDGASAMAALRCAYRSSEGLKTVFKMAA